MTILAVSLVAVHAVSTSPVRTKAEARELVKLAQQALGDSSALQKLFKEWAGEVVSKAVQDSKRATAVSARLPGCCVMFIC